jgi:hypothetical protein
MHLVAHIHDTVDLDMEINSTEYYIVEVIHSCCLIVLSIRLKEYRVTLKKAQGCMYLFCTCFEEELGLLLDSWKDLL